MANKQITELDDIGALDGTEEIPVQDGDGVTGKTTLADIAALVAIPVIIQIALSDNETELETATGVGYVRSPQAFTLTAVRASLKSASSSGVVTVDINVNGSTILSTKLSVDASEKTSVTAATPAVISSASIVDDAEITFDIDAAGTDAAGLVVTLIGTAA